VPERIQGRRLCHFDLRSSMMFTSIKISLPT
jgi:hypothetical protein